MKYLLIIGINRIIWNYKIGLYQKQRTKNARFKDSIRHLEALSDGLYF